MGAKEGEGMAAWRKTEYPADKAEMYALLYEQLTALLQGETSLIPCLANASALLFQALPDINWAGFYLWTGSELLLGPFQGMPACVHIAMGRGVCGAAAETRLTQRIEDVHRFAGHIACDASSRSEIVIPLLWQDRLLGVLDIDSPQIGRFDQADQDGLEKLARMVADCWHTCNDAVYPVQ